MFRVPRAKHCMVDHRIPYEKDLKILWVSLSDNPLAGELPEDCCTVSRVTRSCKIIAQHVSQLNSAIPLKLSRGGGPELVKFYLPGRKLE